MCGRTDDVVVHGRRRRCAREAARVAAATAAARDADVSDCPLSLIDGDGGGTSAYDSPRRPTPHRPPSTSCSRAATYQGCRTAAIACGLSGPASGCRPGASRSTGTSRPRPGWARRASPSSSCLRCATGSTPRTSRPSCRPSRRGPGADDCRCLPPHQLGRLAPERQDRRVGRAARALRAARRAADDFAAAIADPVVRDRYLAGSNRLPPRRRGGQWSHTGAGGAVENVNDAVLANGRELGPTDRRT